MTKEFHAVFFETSIWILKNFIKSRAGFDIHEVSPLDEIKVANCPALFGHTIDDKLIPFEHCEILFTNYRSNSKILFPLRGGHQARRSKEWYQKGIEFVLICFGLKKGTI